MIKDGGKSLLYSEKADTACNIKSHFFHLKGFPNKSKKNQF